MKVQVGYLGDDDLQVLEAEPGVTLAQVLNDAGIEVQKEEKVRIAGELVTDMETEIQPDTMVVISRNIVGG